MSRSGLFVIVLIVLDRLAIELARTIIPTMSFDMLGGMQIMIFTFIISAFIIALAAQFAFGRTFSPVSLELWLWAFVNWVVSIIVYVAITPLA